MARGKPEFYLFADVMIFDGSKPSSTFVMAGLDPVIQDFAMMVIFKSWMPDIKSGMTLWMKVTVSITKRRVLKA